MENDSNITKKMIDDLRNLLSGRQHEFFVLDKDLYCIDCNNMYFIIKENKAVCKKCGAEHHKIKNLDDFKPI